MYRGVWIGGCGQGLWMGCDRGVWTGQGMWIGGGVDRGVIR